MFSITDLTKPIMDLSNFKISSLSDALLFGGSILLIGLAAVFIVLCILWIFLAIFKLSIHNVSRKRATKRSTTVSIEAAEEMTKEVHPSDTEIIAVIAAAIAMAESEHSDHKFRVVSFRRV